MTSATPLLSIVIPAYNMQRYVKVAIDSALAQTYPRIEVVVVDDGSTDKTSEVIAGYGDAVVAVRQTNRGLAGARNSGIVRSSGDLLGWLDADDAWRPERAERCIAMLTARPELAAVTTDAFLIDDDTLSERRYYADLCGGGFPEPAQQLGAIADRNFMFVGALVRRSVVLRLGGFDESLRRAEDYDLWMRLLLAGERLGFLNEPLAEYRIRSDSLSADTRAQWQAHTTVVRKHLAALAAQGVVPNATTLDAVARLDVAAGSANRRSIARLQLRTGSMRQRLSAVKHAYFERSR